MIEPRNKHKMKRKFRVKYQQKRAFREFEEKFDKEIKADEARAAKERKLKWIKLKVSTKVYFLAFLEFKKRFELRSSSIRVS